MLTIDNLSFAYNKIQALTDVSFSLNDGEIMAIIGANGAGKSTLMKCIAGVLKPNNGEIKIDGNLLSNKPHEVVKNGICLVPEGRWIFPGLSVEENLEIGGYTSNNVEEGKELAFKMFPRLLERRKQRAGTLSGGEQQRVGLARALVNSPDLIIADEPTGNLDPVLSNDIMSLFDKINALGATVVVVTHDLELVHQFDHRIVTIEEGKIVSDIPARANRNEDVSFAAATEAKEETENG